MVRGIRFACFLILLAAAGATPLIAHQADQTSYSGSPVPAEILDRPISLHSGIGLAHQKVSTSSSQAQAFYDQGLAYLNSYVWIEAVRSFHQALRLDPDLGMAYVQIADAYIGLQDLPGAQSACDKAQALESHMNENERTWLDIRQSEVDYLADASREKYEAYEKAVGDAVKASPQDPWLWVQRGLASEASPLMHGQAGGVEALSFYKRALAIDPNNLAAVHYSVHANENLERIEKALAGSALYVRLAPAIPHAHHMHGHELMRLGHTEQAIQEFLKAKELEESYCRTENIPLRYDWHYAHNLQLLALNYELLGQVKAADTLLRRTFSLPTYTEFLDYNRRVWPEFLINRRRYEEALEASRELAQSRWPMTRLAGHTLSGEALIGLDRLKEAKAELALADQETEHLPARIVAALPYPNELRGEILLRENQTRAGEGVIVGVERSMISMPGPDAWVSALFALESIARDARRAGDWDLARFTAEEMIRHDPYYAGGHFALGLVAEHAGEGAGSRAMFENAQKLWIHADQDLPELALTRKELATIR